MKLGTHAAISTAASRTSRSRMPRTMRTRLLSNERASEARIASRGFRDIGNGAQIGSRPGPPRRGAPARSERDVLHVAAVDVQVLPDGEPRLRAREEGDRGGDVLGLAEAADHAVLKRIL